MLNTADWLFVGIGTVFVINGLIGVIGKKTLLASYRVEYFTEASVRKAAVMNGISFLLIGAALLCVSVIKLELFPFGDRMFTLGHLLLIGFGLSGLMVSRVAKAMLVPQKTAAPSVQKKKDAGNESPHP